MASRINAYEDGAAVQSYTCVQTAVAPVVVRATYSRKAAAITNLRVNWSPMNADFECTLKEDARAATACDKTGICRPGCKFPDSFLLSNLLHDFPSSSNGSVNILLRVCHAGKACLERRWGKVDACETLQHFLTTVKLAWSLLV